MASDIYVTFGGDTNALDAAIAAGKAQIQSFAREMNKAARAMNDAGASADSELGQKLLAATVKLNAAKDHFAGLGAAAKEGFGGLEMSARQGAHAVHGILELITGETERAGRTFTSLAIHLAAENVGFTSLAAVALGLGAAFGYVAYQAHTAHEAVRSLQNAAAANGFTMATEQSKALIASIQTLGDLSQSAAVDIGKAFAPLGPEAGAIVARMAAADIKALSASEKELGTTAQEVAKRFIDLDSEGKKYVETSRNATQEDKEHMAAWVASGDKANAYLLILRLMSPAITATAKAHELAIAKIQDHAAALERSRLSGESLTEAEKHIDSAVDDVNAKFERQAAEADKMGAALLNASFDADKLSKALTTAMQVDKVADEVKKANDQILSLKAGLAASPDAGAASQLNRALEIAEDHLKKLHQEASDGLLGRDAVKQTEESIKEWQASTKASQDQVRQHAMAVWQAMASDQSLSLELQHEAHEKYIDLVIAGDNKAAKAGVKAAKDELDATEHGIEGQISDLERATEYETKHDEVLVKLKAMTEAQKAADVIKNLKSEEAAIDALYAKELTLAGLTKDKIVEIQHKLREENDKITEAMADPQAKAAEKTEQAWDSAAKTFSNAFTSQIDPLLKGTESWRTAGKKVLADLTEDTIKYFVEQGILATTNAAKQLVLGNTIVAAHVSGDATMAEADASSSAAGLGGILVSVASAIKAFAGEVGAGVAAFMAPVIGPAAPAAGVAAEMSVLGFAVAGADIGMWDVPHDQLTMIHQNELVATASQADAIRAVPGILANGGGVSGAGGGVTVAPTTHFHVSALDGASVSQWMRDNSSNMAKSIDEAVRHGVLLGTKRLKLA
jgi:hypothetical protein